jgi:hypothetical protein
MLAKLHTFALSGIDAVAVTAEVDASAGLPKTISTLVKVARALPGLRRGDAGRDRAMPIRRKSLLGPRFLAVGPTRQGVAAPRRRGGGEKT